MKNNLKQFIFPILLVALTFFILKPLFSSQLLYSDDAEFHAARVANYYLAVKQGQIPPRWAPNLNDGYGYPVFNFAYPLPYIVSTFIYMALSITIVTSLNLTMILLTTIGVLGIYYLAKQFSLSTRKSALAAVLYLTAPHTLINIYSRFALGEMAFFALLPWVMWSMENFIRKKKVRPLYSLVLTLLLALLILSHQTSVVVTLPILAIYYWLRIKNKGERIALIKRIALLGTISLLLSAWYWLPALAEKKFVILDRENTITHYLDQFPIHWSLLFHKLTNLERLDVLKIVSIGYSNLIIILVSLWLMVKNKIRNKKETYYLSIVFFLIIILMMPFTRPLWLASNLSKYIQYPWRLLSTLTLSSTLLFIHLVKNKLINNFFIGMILVASLVSTLVYAQPRGFQAWSDYELLEYFKTTTTFNEFQPIWAAKYIRNFPVEKVSFRITDKNLFGGDALESADYASLEIQNWNGSEMKYVVKNDQPVEVVQKTFYFPGWELVIDDQKQQIEHQDEEFPGHITYSLEPGQHQVQLKFTQNTTARKIGNNSFIIGIGLVSLILLI